MFESPAGKKFLRTIRKTRVKKKGSRSGSRNGSRNLKPVIKEYKAAEPVRKVYSGIKARIPFGTRLGQKTQYTPLTLWKYAMQAKSITIDFPHCILTLNLITRHDVMLQWMNYNIRRTIGKSEVLDVKLAKWELQRITSNASQTSRPQTLFTTLSLSTKKVTWLVGLLCNAEFLACKLS